MPVLVVQVFQIEQPTRAQEAHQAVDYVGVNGDEEGVGGLGIQGGGDDDQEHGGAQVQEKGGEGLGAGLARGALGG